MGSNRCFQRDGQLYFGEVLEKENGVVWREGKGLQVIRAATVDGTPIQWGRYKGAWKSDDMSGTGRYDWNDGSTYEGSFRNGKPHGYGRLTWPEGSTYDGAWECGDMMGQGSFINAFTGITRHGYFHRNSLRQHDGSWLDVAKEREKMRKESLLVGAVGPQPESRMRITYCTPADLGLRLEELRRQPPFLVPMIVADTSVSSTSPIERGPDWEGAPSAAPLWCLEDADCGCVAETAVHLAYAAAEQKRKRDVPAIIRAAIQKALLSYRYFALVFGEGYTSPSADHGHEVSSAAIPPEWSLKEYMHPTSLPPDLFDLRYFHGSGAADAFLPPELAAQSGLVLPPKPDGGDAGGVGAATDADGNDAGRHSAAKSGGSLPTAYLLQFAMVSLKRLEEGMDDVEIRKYFGVRFGAYVPLHRVAVVVVQSP